jgi:hypothetical protein
MGDLGVSSAGVIILRCGTAAVFFAATMLATGPDQFRVKLRDLWCFIGSGICSLLFLHTAIFRP